MGKLKSHITNGSTKVGNSSVSYTLISSCEANGIMLTLLVTFLQDDIKKMLGGVCDEIGFLKSLCRLFVNKYTVRLCLPLPLSPHPYMVLPVSQSLLVQSVSALS